MALETKTAKDLNYCVICNNLIYRNEKKFGEYFIHTQCSTTHIITSLIDINELLRKREFKAIINEFVVDFIRTKQYINIKEIFYTFNKINNVPDLKKRFFKNSKKILLAYGFEKRSKAVTCTAFMRKDEHDKKTYRL
ncbi:hypothetical protein DSAG12_02265 [Promethearchaeum syntrophicum]|uniref:Uncharacterized protein n=1 Tax=Promethearchaeum syntrophicum TaxID=2594042 RepID=A0A5B9DBT0_9ARCH|nr:hypothetical protein [Candidatus Prometheoarchaeum syntrophicum]QEE16435.1 hypothetical protein DSAG12_02265 [Candidatus Prometheoarchaeum syntrophicum]